ncbi:four-carbon acid sugar kinase family protein [Cyanobium sp. WAJ14-Wanaka]|nr:four-carbon acid sugar kinase family protein [Cyanobium sp. WAJ14-Wanaka]
MKIVVIDDDPTGSQTVHSCPLLLRWDAASLRRGLAHPSPLLFLLANTRSLDPGDARQRIREICRALKPELAAGLANGTFERCWIVSRGDSTLRGHFPLEAEVLAEELAAELGPFDASFLAPAFLPGGRTTAGGVHYLHGQPVHSSAFAQDRLFGYGTSFLPDWIREKTGGRAGPVQLLSSQLLEGPKDSLISHLAGLAGNPWVVLDAERPQHLEAFGAAVRELTAPTAAERWGRPRRFLYQAAASLINGLLELPEQPLDARGLAALRRRDLGGNFLPGLVVVGSHVPLADAQLEHLLASGSSSGGSSCGGVEINVAKLARVLAGPAAGELLASLERSWLEKLEAVIANGLTPVLFSSRGEVVCANAFERRKLGMELAALMARLVAALAPGLGYLISKGGITTQVLLADGLGLAAVELQGQLLPGLSLVLSPPEAAVPLLPVLTFPGNLGTAETLSQAWQLLEGAEL